MPSWFDLLTLDATGPEDEVGIKKVLFHLKSFQFFLVHLMFFSSQAAALVNGIIDEEIKAGIPAERIMIGTSTTVCDL